MFLNSSRDSLSQALLAPSRFDHPSRVVYGMLEQMLNVIHLAAARARAPLFQGAAR